MDFAQQQRNPTRHLIGITFVVLLHILVIYALVTGLARKAVEVIKKPLTATIIEEVKLPPPPPPPPPKRVIEPPKAQPRGAALCAAAGYSATAGAFGTSHLRPEPLRRRPSRM